MSLNAERRSEIRPETCRSQSFDQGLELVKLVFAGDQRGLARMDDDQVIDAQGRNDAAVVGDDDRVPGIAGQDVPLDGVACRVDSRRR